MRLRIWLYLVVVLAMVLSACAAPVAPAPSGEQAAESPSGAVGEFHSAWPYTAPPNGHFNTFVTNGYDMNIYHFLLEPPLFMYMWDTDTWMPLAGKSWEWVDDTTLRVKLPEGAVWSDGSPYTSKDVVDTFTIRRLLNQVEWTDHLVDVKAVDDNTVDFLLKAPSNTAPRRIIRDVYIRASSVYGEWADKVRGPVEAGKDAGRSGVEGSEPGVHAVPPR